MMKGRRSVDFRLKEKQILDSVLGPRVYDRRIRPAGVNSSGIYSTYRFSCSR